MVSFQIVYSPSPVVPRNSFKIRGLSLFCVVFGAKWGLSPLAFEVLKCF